MSLPMNILDGQTVISFNHYWKRGLRSVNGFSFVKYKFHLVFGTCAEEKERKCVVLCLCTFSHFLSSFLSLAHSLVTPFLPRALPHFISAFIPTASISHFSRFCLLTFHLSAEQIPLQLPKLCQKALPLFIYFSLLLFCGKQFKWQVLLDGIDSS